MAEQARWVATATGRDSKADSDRNDFSKADANPLHVKASLANKAIVRLDKLQTHADRSAAQARPTGPVA